ncbi:MAG: GntR family transcriptional regulator [Anaerovoracaceae bacterium]
MFQIDLKNRKLIYEQVVDNIKQMVIKGVLKEESKLPSVRELSKELTVNPNTIQKAYKKLESDGYIYTVAGLGCFVAAREHIQIDNKRTQAMLDDLRAIVRELIYAGMNESKIIKIIKEEFEEGGGSVDNG